MREGHQAEGTAWAEAWRYDFVSLIVGVGGFEGVVKGRTGRPSCARLRTSHCTL